MSKVQLKETPNIFHRQMPGRVPVQGFLKGEFLNGLSEKACLMQKPRQKWAENPWEKSMLPKGVFLSVCSPDYRPNSFGHINGAESDE